MNTKEQLEVVARYKIYCLVCPIEGRVKYVGYTSKSLAERLKKHISKSKNEDRTMKDKWLNHLGKLGLAPTINVLQYASDKEAAEILEMRLIESYRSSGGLVNMANGGSGNKGYKMDERNRQLMADKAKVPILMLTRDWQKLALFPYINEAAELMGLNRRAISNTIHGRAETCGGFRWTAVALLPHQRRSHQ